MSYSRYENVRQNKSDATPLAPGAEQAPAEEPIRVNGYAQILEMLKVADPAFRESLLRRLATRDYVLAQKMRKALAEEEY